MQHFEANKANNLRVFGCCRFSHDSTVHGGVDFYLFYALPMRNKPSENQRSSKRWKRPVTQRMLERDGDPDQHVANPNPNLNASPIPLLNHNILQQNLPYLQPNPGNFPPEMLTGPLAPTASYPFPLSPNLSYHHLTGAGNIPFVPTVPPPLDPGAPGHWASGYPSEASIAVPHSPSTMDRHPRRNQHLLDHANSASRSSMTAQAQSGSRSFHAGSSYTGDNRGSRNMSHSNGGSSRTRVQNLNYQSSRRLGSMNPIREALAGFSDDSHIISRFAQFCSESGCSIQPSLRRSTIHNFSGFSVERRPPVEILTILNKPDLDSLAWALGLSKGGRKIEIATRIGQAMRSPLQWRMPSTRRGTKATSTPPINSSTPSWSAMGQMQPPANDRVTPPTNSANGSRGNMPTLRRVNYQNKQPPQPRRRGKDMSSLLTDQTFMFAENPFNLPLDTPLGLVNYVVFTATQLTNGLQEPRLTFHTPDLAALNVGTTKGKGDIQVHLRCLKVEIGKPVHCWKQSWPFPASAKVNSSNVELNQAQRFTNGKLAGMDKATNITLYLRNRRLNAPENIVVVRRSANSTAIAQGSFVVFAQPVLVRSTKTMMSIVRDHSVSYWSSYRRTQISKGMKPQTSDFEMARRQVMALMTGSDDFSMLSQKMSLKCPLSLIPISIPAKGKDCTHVQCFDLNSFLEFTRRSTKFSCPVCVKHEASPSALIISPFVEHALSMFAGCDEVEIFADGGIKAVQNQRTGVPSAQSESEDDTSESNQSKFETNSNDAMQDSRAAAAKSVDVVDLTLDSDDDEVLPQTPHFQVSRDLPSSGANRPTHTRNNIRENTMASNGLGNGNGDVNIRSEQSVGDFSFEATFQAEEQFLPWEFPDDQASTDNGSHIGTPRESTPARSGSIGQELTRDSNASNHNSNSNNQGGWPNSSDVITIDDSD